MRRDNNTFMATLFFAALQLCACDGNKVPDAACSKHEDCKESERCWKSQCVDVGKSKSQSEAEQIAQQEKQRQEQEQKREAELAAKAQAQAEAEAALQKMLSWDYWKRDLDMGGTVATARVLSQNEVSFDFPYQGVQRGELMLREHSEYGKDVILSVDRGQFLCGFRGCRVEVRFDDGESFKVRASQAADHSTEMIFLSNYSKLKKLISKSTTMRVKADFYQEGSRVFEFNVSGFDPDKMK